MRALIKKFPFLTRLSFFVLLPVVIVLLLALYILFLTLPKVGGTEFIRNINSQIEVDRSESGIPHIKSSIELDAHFGLGLCHAQDRLWQMEINKRKAYGTLSEVFGLATVESDKFFKILNLSANAKKIWERLPEKDKDVLISYSNGVNEGIAQSKVLPIEFLLNGVKPVSWTPIDSIVIMQLMTWNLSTNMASEMRRLLLLRNFGIEKTNQLMPPIQLPKSVIDGAAQSQAVDTFTIDNNLWLTELTPKNFIGSNAWVISGKYTKSGLPMLANDPHLATSIPSIWYLAHLQAPDLDVKGATMPGLPFVVIGRNKDIAWGMTTMMADTQDIILEKINPLNKNQYENQEKYIDMQVTKENINVKSDFLRPAVSPIQLDVRRTVNGPLISDIGTFINGFSYSLRWTGDDEDGGTISSFIKLNRAKNWSEFNEALESFVAPVHYFVYADEKGNIGSLSPGKIPVRSFGDGSIPLEGWLHDSNWKGWIPFSDIPRKYNPSKGYIVSANNKVVEDDYSYNITSDWASDDRAKRIESELSRLIARTNKKIQTSDMVALQRDVKSNYENLFFYLSKIPAKNKTQEAVLNILHQWNGYMDVNTVSGTILQAWIFHINKLLLEDDFDGVKGLESFALKVNYKLLEDVIVKKESEWCDYKKTSQLESCEEIEYLALDHAIYELTMKLGKNPKKWTWGDIHKLQFVSFPYSKSKYSSGWPKLSDSPLSYAFHRAISSSGDDTTVNVAPISGDKNNRYSQFWAASYRQLVDFSGSDEIQFEQLTGQSGNVFSRFYDNAIDKNNDPRLLKYGRQKNGSSLVLLPLSQRAIVE